MLKKDSPPTAAVIEIASNELRLKIGEKGKNKLKIIDSLTIPISLGRDTFHNDKISFEKVEKTSTTIKNFQTVIKEYGVKKVTAIATTAVREATNKDYILDQIKIKTSINLNVIDDNQEKMYINNMSLHIVDNQYKQSALMVHIGSGNIGISVIENGNIISTQNIRVGSLRLSELFEDMFDSSGRYSLIIEEYLQTFIDSIELDIPKNIKYFITTGNEISMLSSLCDAKNNNNCLIIKKENFSKVYKDIKTKTPEQIAHDYNITVDKADVLFPAVIIYNKLLKYTKAEQIFSPPISLSDALLYEMLYPEQAKEMTSNLNKSTIISADNIAKKFNIDSQYYQNVKNFSTKIYDKLKKVHGLGSRERLLLQISAMLQNIGKYVNVKEHYFHSYNIIKGCNIVGLSEYEIDVIANICLYHSRITPSLDHENYSRLETRERVLVSKLCSILRLADSLNRSHNSKFDDIDVKLSDDELIITIKTYKNIELEEWSFYKKSKLFEEVFGIKAIIKKKKVI